MYRTPRNTVVPTHAEQQRVVLLRLRAIAGTVAIA